MGSLELTRLSDFTFTFDFHALEKEMATHSSVLAWCDPHSQWLGIVNKPEVDVFLELSYFFNDPANVGNLISASSAFLKSA